MQCKGSQWVCSRYAVGNTTETKMRVICICSSSHRDLPPRIRSSLQHSSPSAPLHVIPLLKRLRVATRESTLLANASAMARVPPSPSAVCGICRSTNLVSAASSDASAFTVPAFRKEFDRKFKAVTLLASVLSAERIAAIFAPSANARARFSSVHLMDVAAVSIQRTSASTIQKRGRPGENTLMAGTAHPISVRHRHQSPRVNEHKKKAYMLTQLEWLQNYYYRRTRCRQSYMRHVPTNQQC